MPRSIWESTTLEPPEVVPINHRRTRPFVLPLYLEHVDLFSSNIVKNVEGNSWKILCAWERWMRMFFRGLVHFDVVDGLLRGGLINPHMITPPFKMKFTTRSSEREGFRKRAIPSTDLTLALWRAQEWCNLPFKVGPMETSPLLLIILYTYLVQKLALVPTLSAIF